MVCRCRSATPAVAAILGAIRGWWCSTVAIANVALPSIAQQLHAAPADAVWIATAYQLAIVMFPAARLPRLAKRLGYRRVFARRCRAVFTAASVLCALAPSFAVAGGGTVPSRALGSAAVMPLGLCAAALHVIRVDCWARRSHGTRWRFAGASAAGPGRRRGPLLSNRELAVALRGEPAARARWCWPPVPGCPVRKAGGHRLDRREHRTQRDHVRRLRAGQRLAAVVSVGRGCIARPSLPQPRFCWYGAEMAEGAAPVDFRLIFCGLPSFRLSIIASVCCFTGQMLGLCGAAVLLPSTSSA